MAKSLSAIDQCKRTRHVCAPQPHCIRTRDGEVVPTPLKPMRWRQWLWFAQATEVEQASTRQRIEFDSFPNSPSRKEFT